MKSSVERRIRLGLAGTAVALALTSAGPAWAQGQIQVDPNLKSYQPVVGIAGNLNSVGSDTLNNLMTFWVEGFRKLYPNVNIGIEGKGSSTAPPALIAGTAQLGPMSRAMKKSEVTELEGTYGFKPTELWVALDSLAVFVNKDNPVQSLSLAQVDAIFSKGCKRGLRPITTWGDAGVQDAAWATRPISLYGRNSASGTYGFFKEHVLSKGDFKDTVKEFTRYINGVKKTPVFYQEVKKEFCAMNISEDSIPYKLTVEAGEMIGLEMKPLSIGGGTNASVYNEKGLPSVIIGCGMRDEHTTSEHASIADMETSAKLCLGIVMKNHERSKQ